MKKPILIVMSDQHRQSVLGCNGNEVVETPNLDRFAKEGTNYTNAYTSCPLCVPARWSFMTGKMPSDIGVFDNQSTISDDHPTFAHQMTNAGYETVLCGRMHFLGKDQNRGFQKRLVGDITQTIWNKGNVKPSRGIFKDSFSVNGAIHITGYGQTPVMDYDDAVVAGFEDYMETLDQDNVMVVVGLYGPHFPYVTSEDLYKKYLKKLSGDIVEPWNASGSIDKEKMIKLRAAYYGQVELFDQNFGKILKAWEDKFGKEGLCIYLSDHGDMIGERDLIGKKCFYDGSVKIPMLVRGGDFDKDKRISSAASIMDIGQTVMDYAGCQDILPNDGMNLMKLPKDRVVRSELYTDQPCQMIAMRSDKLIYENNSVTMYKDDLECENQDELEHLKAYLEDTTPVEIKQSLYEMKKTHHKIIKTWWENNYGYEDHRWQPEKKYDQVWDVDIER